jgi:hypothetical protein
MLGALAQCVEPGIAQVCHLRFTTWGEESASSLHSPQSLRARGICICRLIDWVCGAYWRGIVGAELLRGAFICVGLLGW